MKRYQIILGAMLLAMPLAAQDIYKVESFNSTDLIGTARFVGMGGAMGTLGADLSTIHTNPAGMGMFRRSDASATLTMNITPGAESFANIGKTRMSFDQLGFVYAYNSNSPHLKYVNFAMNYQKTKNLKNYFGIAAPITGGLSQSWQMANLADYYGQWDDGSGDWVSPIAHAGWNSFMVDRNQDGQFFGCDANDYSYEKVMHGGVQAFDFNISFNWDNQWYLGATLGAYSVDWNSYLLYGENLLDEDGGLHPYSMVNDEKITGSGMDFKLGFIGRPIEESPFRFGLSVATPTWFNLTGNNILTMDSPFVGDGSEDTHTISGVRTGDFDYRVTTPWTFGIGVATTIDNFLALDAEYEYKDYTGASVRYSDGYDPFYDGSMYSNSHRDKGLVNEINRYMSGVSTFRIGAEVRFDEGAYLRAGYNYVSKPFKDDALLNFYTGYPETLGNEDSEGVINTTGTDYVNLGATNRLTLGLGLRGKNWYADLAYQYQTQGADVYAFQNFDQDFTRENLLPKQSLDLERHAITLTVGYKF